MKEQNLQHTMHVPLHLASGAEQGIVPFEHKNIPSLRLLSIFFLKFLFFLPSKFEGLSFGHQRVSRCQVASILVLGLKAVQQCPCAISL